MDEKHLQYHTRVVSSLGPGLIDAFVADSSPQKIVVVHRRSEFSAADWKTISPLNSPAVFREYTLDELTYHPEPFPVKNYQKFKSQTWNDVAQGAEDLIKGEKKARKPMAKKEAQDQPATQKPEVDLNQVQLGTLWKSKRSEHVFVVASIENGVVRLSWTAGRYTRDVKVAVVATQYVYVGVQEAQPEPTPEAA